MKKMSKMLRLTKESVRTLTAEELVEAVGLTGVACGETTAPSCGGSCVEATCFC